MWYRYQQEKIEMLVKVKPNAHKKCILRIEQDRLLISIRAKPHDGKANIELIEFLSDEIGLSKSYIDLQSGITSRYKVVSVPNCSQVLAFISRVEQLP